MTEPVGIDAGHGYTKAIRLNGARVLFPSLICPAPATVDLGEFGSQPPLTQINDKLYLVGEAARRHATPLWDRDKAADEDTARLIMVAAAQLGLSGPLRLATGLPLSWWGEQRRAFKASLQGLEARVTVPGRLPTRLWLEEVLVLPQGVAAAGPILAQSQYLPGPYLVVDWGERTTDYIIVVKKADGRLDFDPAAAGSLELGCHAIATGIAARLTAQYHTPFQAVALADLGAVAVRGERVDLAPLREEAKQSVTRQIGRALHEALGYRLEQVLGILAVGGGSPLLKEALPAVTQPLAAQWANVEGYLGSVAS